MDEQELRFVEALAANKYDGELRLVYADYLEEHGKDDEAQFQRKWTPRWQKAWDWMEEFAKEAQEDKYPITIETILEACKEYLETGEQIILGVMGFGATNQFYDPGFHETFWEHYEVLAGVNLDESFKEHSEPFRCCY